MLKIVIKGVELTVDEARTVYKELKKVFGNESVLPYQEWYPPTNGGSIANCGFIDTGDIYEQ